MRGLLLYLGLFLLLVTACGTEPYPGYASLGREGMHYQVLRFNEEGAHPQQGDMLRFRMSRVENDSVVWRDSRVQIIRYDTLADGLRSALTRFHVGDSISILLEPEAYWEEFGEYPDPMSRVSDLHLSILGVIPESEWLKALAMDRAQKSEREQRMIRDYVDAEGHQLRDSIWIKELGPSSGRPVSSEDELLVMYTASLLDGRVIDARSSRSDAILYRLGMPGQLIPGLERAIPMMKLGQEVEVVIPSQLAFGDDGSAGDVVPAWTALRYRLRVVLREES